MARRKRPATRGPYLLHVELLRERIADASVYPFSLPVVRHLETLPFHPKVTFLIGENGSGKSTLLEAVAAAYGLNPEGGSRNFNFASRASHSKLEEHLRLARPAGAMPLDAFFLRAESFYNVASEIERLGVGHNYGAVPLHAQSHGESFFSLFEKRFGFRADPSKTPVPGLYLLDEPEAALSPRRQLEFLGLLHRYVGEGSQFLIATHSPIVMAYPDAWIYWLRQDAIERVPYVETEHYLVTRRFLNHPERGLRELLSDDVEPEPAE